MQTTSRPSDEDEPDKIPLDRLDAGPAGVSLYRALDHHYADTGSVSKLYRLRVACLLVFSAVFCWSVYTSFMHNDPWETSKCRMAYMSPGYLRLDGLNASHSRMAGKYSLWLYREQGWDLSNKPHGVPVLFAPGNAGSYRQVRSLAAAAARQYYSSPGRPDERRLSVGQQELDFFAADFNEDFSAFHAGTLKEQAEYLADCIKYIRALYSDQGDAAPSAVIVIAHSMGGIAARYMFLQEGFEFESVKTLITLSTPHTIPPATFDRGVERIYHHINTFWQESHKSVYSPLNDTLSVSLAGGIADTMISSDYADMSSLVPRSHGFSVITTSVPTLFSPVDHLAMMWCDQLRQQIISALLESTDLHRVDRTRRLDERLAIFQSHLLTGAELIPSTVAPLTAATLDRSNYEYVNASLSLSKEMVVNDSLYRFDLAGKEGRRAQVTIAGHGVTVKYYACEGPDQQSTCHLVEQPQLVNIPSDNIDPQSPVQRTGLPIFFSDVEMPASAAYCLLQISKTSGSLVQAHTQAPFVEIGTSLLNMYLFGWKYDTRRMPAVPSGFAWLFTRLDNPLMVYSLSVTADEKCSQIMPVVRVSSGGAFESHFFAGNVKQAGIHLHSGAPYLPSISGSSSGIMLQVWHDPSCPLEVEFSVNRKASLGTVVTRYRSVVASWPILILLGVMRHLLVPSRVSSEVAHSKTFDSSLQAFLISESRWWMTVVVLVGGMQVLLLHLEVMPAAFASVLLGTRHVLLLFLVPALLAVVMSAVLLSNIMLGITISLFSRAFSATFMASVFRKEPERSRSRLLGFAFLSLFVLLFAPHQFAILSLFLMQFLTTSQAERSTSETNYAVLAILLWLLPQNGAILVVWLRNLQAGWWRPFPSDHNVFAILGPMLLVEHLSSGKALRLPSNKWVIYMTDHVLTFAMLFILLWGSRYVFVVGETVNLLFIGLAILQYDSIRKFL